MSRPSPVRHLGAERARHRESIRCRYITGIRASSRNACRLRGQGPHLRGAARHPARRPVRPAQEAEEAPRRAGTIADMHNPCSPYPLRSCAEFSARIIPNDARCGSCDGATPCAGAVISEEYQLEYGTDRLEMHVGAVQPGQRVLLVWRHTPTPHLAHRHAGSQQLPHRRSLTPALSAVGRRPHSHRGDAPRRRSAHGARRGDGACSSGGCSQSNALALPRLATCPENLRPPQVVEAACVIGMPELKGREKIAGKFPLYTLIDVAGH